MSIWKAFAAASLGIVSGAAFAGEAVIIDHNCTDVSKVPQKYIEKAKQDFRISYGHTSHGSQIVSGMEALRKADPELYAFGRNGKSGELQFLDGAPAGDLGNPDRTTWAQRTREFLGGDKGKGVNLVMWSWCGQAGSASEADMQTYLDLMAGLEKEFPKVKFVYMTGHLDGKGKDGNLNKRNTQIRDFCKRNGKVLFDFADIESYAPGGKVNYMELGADDGCNYNEGGARRNWADEWLSANPGKVALPDSAAHTKPLNGALKGRAFWWMLAVLSGWNPGN